MRLDDYQISSQVLLPVLLRAAAMRRSCGGRTLLTCGLCMRAREALECLDPRAHGYQEQHALGHAHPLGSSLVMMVYDNNMR